MLSKGESGFNRLFARYRAKARLRGIKFNLDKNIFRILTSSNCFYCGMKPKQRIVENNRTEAGIKHSEYFYNGLDRVDNTKGYVRDNVVPCCRLHNEWKRAMPVKDFIKIIHKTSAYLKSKRGKIEEKI